MRLSRPFGVAILVGLMLTACRENPGKVEASASAGVHAVPVNIAPVVDEIAVEPGARANQTAPQTGQPQQITINLPSGQNTLSYNQDPATAPLAAVRDRTAVTVRWGAHDENGDELVFDVYVRGDGEKNWRLLRSHLTERFYSFDSIRIPDGGYRIRVVASDAAARRKMARYWALIYPGSGLVRHSLLEAVRERQSDFEAVETRGARIVL